MSRLAALSAGNRRGEMVPWCARGAAAAGVADRVAGPGELSTRFCHAVHANTSKNAFQPRKVVQNDKDDDAGSVARRAEQPCDAHRADEAGRKASHQGATGFRTSKKGAGTGFKERFFEDRAQKQARVRDRLYEITRPLLGEPRTEKLRATTTACSGSPPCALTENSRLRISRRFATSVYNRRTTRPKWQRVQRHRLRKLAIRVALQRTLNRCLVSNTIVPSNRAPVRVAGKLSWNWKTK